MSIRTIIEINHDRAHLIDSARYEFCNLLDLAIRSSSRENWERLERFGVRLILTTHHSDERLDMAYGLAAIKAEAKHTTQPR